ncbi:MAG: recombinase family protein [Bryobacteraceae bacterium]|jgi:DNA invertase Pin-like site-specific DNA recombinase
MPAPKDRAATHAKRVVLYARVSSKDQEKEGYSIPAQERSLRDYALQHGMVIVEEFVDVETAKRSGRTAFTAMLEYLKKHRATCQTILVEKTDRLYRNLKDWTTLDDLDTTIHLVKEGRIIGPDSRSSDHLAHGINVLMARNYILNLGEETRKGMTEKARAGIYPSYAPVGYRNVNGTNGKRTIVSDPDTAPMITDIFGRFARGQHSVKSLVKEMNAEGALLRGRKLQSSVVHQVLRKRLYTGDFDWDGITYTGTHEPLVTRECWLRVQELLDARAKNRTRKVKHDFAYTGLVHCGHCGCLLVGELKKGTYVYYHCTGNRGKCPEPYTRQETLSAEFAHVLRELVIPPPVLEWLGDAVLDSDRTEQAARAESIKKLRVRYEQIEARIETMYMDKLDGRINQELFDKQATKMGGEQDSLLRRIQEIEKATPAPVDQAIDMLRLTSRASELFLQQPASEQRRLLQTVLEEAAWKDGALRTTLFEPFEILRHSNQESYRKEKQNCGSGSELEIWLPRKDSNPKFSQATTASAARSIRGGLEPPDPCGSLL